MDENKGLAEVPPRRHVRRAERERILTLWSETGVSAREMARQTGVSPSSLFRWKRGPRSRSAPMTRSSLMEVPAQAGGGWAAEVSTGCGAVRFSGYAEPQWVAQILRELARC